MPNATPSMPAKEIQFNRERGAWAHEHGVRKGLTVGDQGPILHEAFRTIASPPEPNNPHRQARGVFHLPQGLIRIDTPSWEILSRRGMTIRGTGAFPTSTNSNSNVAGRLGGTRLVWDGPNGGGPMLRLGDNCANITLENFTFDLGKEFGANTNHAGVALLLGYPNPGGNGRQIFRNLVFQSFGGVPNVSGVRPGTVAVRVGNPGDGTSANGDTSGFYDCDIRGCEIGYQFHSEQNMEWVFQRPLFQSCNVFFDYVSGGNCHIYGVQAQDFRNNVVIRWVRLTNNGIHNNHFSIMGGYVDRQGNGQVHVLFDTGPNSKTGNLSAFGVHVRRMSVVGDYSGDGDNAAYVEMHSGNICKLDACKLTSQPIVRWRTRSVAAQKSHVTVADTIVHSSRRFGSELVTCLEGGYADTVEFTNCWRGSGSLENDVESVTVNMFPRVGNSRTHWDIDNFGGDDRQPFSSSWLNATGQFGGSPQGLPTAWAGNLRAYYPMNEPLGATSARNLATTTPLANDLTINADQIVSGAPLPYLETWIDYWGAVGTAGLDTGVTINPSGGDNLTIFGFLEVQDNPSTNGCFARIVSGTDFFNILRVHADQASDVNTRTARLSIQKQGDPIEGTVTVGWRWPVFVVVSINGNTARIFVNGTFSRQRTGINYTSMSSGTIFLGARTGLNRFPGKASRVGVIKQALTDKQATLLSLQASVVAELRHRRS